MAQKKSYATRVAEKACANLNLDIVLPDIINAGVCGLFTANELRVFVPRSRRKNSVGPTRARGQQPGRAYRNFRLGCPEEEETRCTYCVLGTDFELNGNFTFPASRDFKDLCGFATKLSCSHGLQSQSWQRLDDEVFAAC
jgi:hypothetical protein